MLCGREIGFSFSGEAGGLELGRVGIWPVGARIARNCFCWSLCGIARRRTGALSFGLPSRSGPVFDGVCRGRGRSISVASPTRLLCLLPTAVAGMTRNLI